MKRDKDKAGLRNWFWMLGVVSLALCIGGCQGQGKDAANKSNESGETTLPKLDFHKPKTLRKAVERLRELHDALSSEEDLPAPLAYRVREVIHGTGAGAHSHYYLDAPGEEHVEEEGHEDMEESERFHDVEVDVFTEARDIVGWLPKIAASSDGVEEETWNSVKQNAKELERLMGASSMKLEGPDKARQKYRSNAESMEAIIKQLEKLVDVGEADGGA